MMIFLPVNQSKVSRLLSKYPALIKQEAEPDGRGYTSAFILDDQLDQAWSLKDVDQSLPWRYRKNPVKIRLFPTPRGFASDTLSDILSTTAHRKLKDRLTSQFGGRCQVCGRARFNKKERRIAPHLFATWLHSRHPNRNKKMGIREILGLASICDDCLGPMTLANPSPCDHVPSATRKQEIHKSIERMAIHNETTREFTVKGIRRSIGERVKELDGCFWVLNLRWLTDKKLLTPRELVLSHQCIKLGYTINRECVVVPPVKKQATRTTQTTRTKRKATPSTV
jgi:hypothetical protein